ncbi:glycosyltransferase family 2 protein [uncultured Desulfovibrio sp.]|uniref:glycosyltransferase family 2 protein n=1 Tax=uncultured Desulfovibrio sp. TaxID=167968 RepID=UPI002604938E|nr:glycosyltransferase family 2 protein [uncultured Desulfovibrio sp.]
MPTNVAIIVPVHDAAQWIDVCMEQLLAQRRLPDEIIFVDDASTDDTVQRCFFWQEKHPSRVRIIQLCANSGPGIARNAGIAACRSAFLAFMDVDDRLSPHFLSRLYDRITHDSLDMVVCGIDVIAPTSSKKLLPADVCDNASLLRQKILLYAPVNKIYRTRFLREELIRFSRCRIGEDMAFAVKLCSRSPRMGVVPEALYQYVRRPGSLSGALRLRHEIFAALDDLHLFLRHAACPPRLFSVYRRLCLLHGLYYPLRLLLRHRRSVSLVQLARELHFYLATTLRMIGESYER